MKPLILTLPKSFSKTTLAKHMPEAKLALIDEWAAVVAPDGSTHWYKSDVNERLTRWSHHDDDDQPTILDINLKSKLPSLPEVLHFDENPDVMTAWFHQDANLPEDLVSLIIPKHTEFDWETLDTLDTLLQALSNMAALFTNQAGTLVLHSETKKGFHISQENDYANMLALTKQGNFVFPSMEHYYKGNAYAELRAGQVDIVAYSHASVLLMAMLPTSFEGWYREYNDGAYESVSGYSSYPQTMEVDIPARSAHDRLAAVTDFFAFLQQFGGTDAQQLLTALAPLHQEITQ